MCKLYVKPIALLLALVALVAVGCSAQTPDVVADEVATASYSGTLRADYADALDATSQLALGTLRLEETVNAVTAAQAAEQLPLWQALSGTVLESEDEQLSVTKQVEATLTEAQVSAIAALHLTQADAQAWLEEQGGGLAAGGGAGTGRGAGGGMPVGDGAGENTSDEDRAAMREQFQNMSDEERAEMRAQMQQSGTSGAAMGTGAGTSGTLIRAVTMLLAERNGQAQGFAAGARPQKPEPEVEATATPEPIEEEPTATPIAQITLVPWQTPDPTPESATTPEPTEVVTSEATAANVTNAASSATASADVVQTATQQAAAAQPEVTVAAPAALEWVPDTDPGPPLTVEVTTNYAEPNPLLEDSLIYSVGGFVHNPTDETYTITAVHVTFYDADGFRGAYYAFPRTGGRSPGGEWIWHGALEADVTCTVLGPGESCPFTAEIAGQNMGSFLVHVDAEIAEWHEPVSVSVTDVRVTDTGVSYVLFTGTVVNENPYPVKNVVVSGLLLDENGQMVSMGTGVVPNIEAGGTGSYTVYVEKATYSSYQLTVLAEQDAK